jgi:hypothetical protein
MGEGRQVVVGQACEFDGDLSQGMGGCDRLPFGDGSIEPEQCSRPVDRDRKERSRRTFPIDPVMVTE